MALNKMFLLDEVDEDQLLQLLHENGYNEIAQLLSNRGIDGQTLLTLSANQIRFWRLSNVEYKTLLHFITEVKENPNIIIRRQLAKTPSINFKRAHSQNLEIKPLPSVPARQIGDTEKKDFKDKLGLIIGGNSFCPSSDNDLPSKCPKLPIGPFQDIDNTLDTRSKGLPPLPTVPNETTVKRFIGIPTVSEKDSSKKSSRLPLPEPSKEVRNKLLPPSPPSNSLNYSPREKHFDPEHNNSNSYEREYASWNLSQNEPESDYMNSVVAKLHDKNTRLYDKVPNLEIDKDPFEQTPNSYSLRYQSAPYLLPKRNETMETSPITNKLHLQLSKKGSSNHSNIYTSQNKGNVDESILKNENRKMRIDIKTSTNSYGRNSDCDYLSPIELQSETFNSLVANMHAKDTKLYNKIPKLYRSSEDFFEHTPHNFSLHRKNGRKESFKISQVANDKYSQLPMNRSNNQYKSLDNLLTDRNQTNDKFNEDESILLNERKIKNEMKATGGYLDLDAICIPRTVLKTGPSSSTSHKNREEITNPENKAGVSKRKTDFFGKISKKLKKKKTETAEKAIKPNNYEKYMIKSIDLEMDKLHYKNQPLPKIPTSENLDLSFRKKAPSPDRLELSFDEESQIIKRKPEEQSYFYKQHYLDDSEFSDDDVELNDAMYQNVNKTTENFTTDNHLYENTLEFQENHNEPNKLQLNIDLALKLSKELAIISANKLPQNQIGNKHFSEINTTTNNTEDEKNGSLYQNISEIQENESISHIPINEELAIKLAEQLAIRSAHKNNQIWNKNITEKNYPGYEIEDEVDDFHKPAPKVIEPYPKVSRFPTERKIEKSYNVQYSLPGNAGQSNYIDEHEHFNQIYGSLYQNTSEIQENESISNIPINEELAIKLAEQLAIRSAHKNWNKNITEKNYPGYEIEDEVDDFHKHAPNIIEPYPKASRFPTERKIEKSYNLQYSLPENADQSNYIDEHERFNQIFNLTDERFFKNTDRNGAKEILQNLPDGAFLFRPSKIYFLVLTIKHKEKYYNLGIELTSNNKIRLKADISCTAPEFESLHSFVEYFKTESVTFQNDEDFIEVFLNPVTLP